MSSNSFGKLFKFTTWGESHGPAIGCVIDGCPPNIQLNEKDIQKFLDKRKPGTSKFVTQRKEGDKVIILSGYWSYLSSGGFNIQNQNYRLPDLLTKTQSESFIQAGKKVLDEIRKSGKRVILMKDIPDLDFNIQSCFDMSPYKNNSINQTNCGYSRYKRG